jgi:hypothetical protein
MIPQVRNSSGSYVDDRSYQALMPICIDTAGRSRGIIDMGTTAISKAVMQAFSLSGAGWTYRRVVHSCWADSKRNRHRRGGNRHGLR